MLLRLALTAAALAATSFVVSAQAESPVARGRYLVESIAGCGNCHTPQGPNGPIAGKELAGGSVVVDAPPFRAVASNITSDKETGIGGWTDAQLAKAIREGIRPDGSLIGPPMPFELYRRMSDTDLKAIVAYLRTVKPVHHKVKKSVYHMPLPKSYGPPVGSVPDVPRSNLVAYGAYLAGPVGHCVECHTPMVRGRRDWSRTGLGGAVFKGPWGASVSANLTPHKDDGLGGWTDAEIKRAIQTGVSKDGRKLNPPMGYPYYARIKPADMNAIVAYLRSLKPFPNSAR
ncbi:MAG: cytochrome c [Rhodospirillaceae bacterium]|nr:cytochrome c [Rhodospirillaceae bacterium]